MFLITGCARSGTRYSFKVLKALGLDVGHERACKDGLVCWQAAYPTEDPVGNITGTKIPQTGRELHQICKPILHQVRHPLHVVKSFRYKSHPKTFNYIAKHLPICRTAKDKTHFGMLYWYYWNQFADKIAAETYRIEQLPEIFEDWCRWLGVSPNRSVLNGIRTDDNTEHTPSSARSDPDFQKNIREPLTWQQMQELDLELCANIRRLALHYGYGAKDL